MKFPILATLLLLAPGIAQAEKFSPFPVKTGQMISGSAQADAERIAQGKKQVRLHVTEAGPCAAPTKMIRHECMKGHEAHTLRQTENAARVSSGRRDTNTAPERYLEQPREGYEPVKHPHKPHVFIPGGKPVKPEHFGGAKPIKPIKTLNPTGQDAQKPFPVKDAEKG